MPSKAPSVSWPDSVLTGALAALVLLAWYALWLGERSPYGHLLLHGHRLAGTHSQWLLPGVFIAGWTLMIVAMMLPSSFPLLLLFRRLIRGRATAVWLLSLLVLGYLSSWLFCGVGLLLLTRYLSLGVHEFSSHTNAAWIISAVILTIAGLYQFSSLKYACLDKCRSPLSFLMSRWRGGNESAQALRIGVEHGLFCVGCCWSLMLLMFLVGAGSLACMLLLGVVMALEKNFYWGRRLSAPLGVLLLVSAAAVVVGGVRS